MTARLLIPALATLLAACGGPDAPGAAPTTDEAQALNDAADMLDNRALTLPHNQQDTP